MSQACDLRYAQVTLDLNLSEYTLCQETFPKFFWKRLIKVALNHIAQTGGLV